MRQRPSKLATVAQPIQAFDEPGHDPIGALDEDDRGADSDEPAQPNRGQEVLMSKDGAVTEVNVNSVEIMQGLGWKRAPKGARSTQ